MKTFEVKTTHTHVFREGWGVRITVFWTGEDEYPRVDGMDAEVVRIDESLGLQAGEFEVVEDLTEDDTHDLRSRWFATKAEADEHLAYTLNRWENPSPWESFVKV